MCFNLCPGLVLDGEGGDAFVKVLVALAKGWSGGSWAGWLAPAKPWFCTRGASTTFGCSSSPAMVTSWWAKCQGSGSEQ